jgi:cytochrome P450
MTAAADTGSHAEAEQIVRRLLADPPQDPYPFYARLREIDPVHRASVGDFWTLTRYEDVRATVEDKRFVRDVGDMQRRHSKGAPVDLARPSVRSQQRWFVFTNPPDYVPKRALYNTVFRRGQVESLRPLMAQFAGELLDQAQERGEMEIVEDLGFQLTVRVISHVLGVPRENTQLLVDYAHVIGGTFDPLVTGEFRRRADEETIKIEGFLHDLVDQARRNPGGDGLLSRLIAADEQGILTEEDLMANIPLVFSAGLETTTHFIGNSVYSLLKSPDQWKLFLSDPDGLVKNAVEELLRYETSVQADAPMRLAAEDIEIGGVTIPKGDNVIPFYGAANRDPVRYQNPDTLDITRQDIKTLGFGGGLHICLGQHIARVETQVALVQLARRFPGMQLHGDEPTWRPAITNRTLNALNVRLA